MILHIHTDASYLSESEARSRAAGYFFMSDTPSNNNTPTDKVPTINGPIHIVSSILRNVMASAAEAEVGAAFMNAQQACTIRTTLDEMGYPQPPTPLQTDNNVAQGILQGTVKQKRSKAIDMRFYWLKDRVAQGQFSIHWKPGATNLADYLLLQTLQWSTPPSRVTHLLERTQLERNPSPIQHTTKYSSQLADTVRVC